MEPILVANPFEKILLKIESVKNEDGDEGIQARVLIGQKLWGSTFGKRSSDANSSMDYPASS
ncbi:hypothetical protein EGJ44_08915 [Ectopseudomonas oleovorans]|uniref:Uncharacterized protein n=1 Tax=Ectopseudomonas oleovorans TaxID=301 RepID=A0A3R8X0R8_ECTOL|nr:hypothetical protein EGJ44_08915 [Pseudomonas oleovorans]